MSAVDINISVDSEIKNQAQDVFATLGLDLTSAIDIFLRQTIQQRTIPFDVPTEPSKKTPKPGCMRGKIWMADDFDAPLEDFKE